MAGSLETNKLIGAVLTAGIIVVGSGVISEILYGYPPRHAPVFTIQLADDATLAEAEEPAETIPFEVLLASADPDAGQRGFRACAACHTVDDGGANRVGPNLYDVLGRDIAGVGGFRYSGTLSDMDGVWTFEKLDGFLKAPNTWAPGTTMSFAGIANDQARADMVAYLRSLSTDPKPLPEVPADEPAEAIEDGEEEAESGQGR